MKKIIIVAALLSLIACSPKDITPHSTVAPQVVEAAGTAPDIQLLLDAVLRQFAIIEVCHDIKNNDYFINIAPHTRVDDRLDAGWWMIDSYTFIELSNSTWLLKSYGTPINVEPDVTGLTCKQQAVNPKWYQN